MRFSIALRREGVAVRKWIADIRTSIPSRQSGAFDSGSIDGYSLIISLHEMSAHQGRQRSIDSHLIHRKRSPFSSKEKERVVEDANPYGVICICAAEWNANLFLAAHPVKTLPQMPHNRFWLLWRLVCCRVFILSKNAQRIETINSIILCLWKRYKKPSRESKDFSEGFIYYLCVNYCTGVVQFSSFQNTALSSGRVYILFVCKLLHGGGAIFDTMESAKMKKHPAFARCW